MPLPYSWDLSGKGKICQHYNAQDDAVDTEGGEGMLSDVLHQTLDDCQTDEEGHHTAHNQHTEFRTRSADAAEDELQSLDGRSAQHGGNGRQSG